MDLEYLEAKKSIRMRKKNEGMGAFDLSLEDFEDEDLSEILVDKDLKLNSYINDSFKVPRKKGSRKSRTQDRNFNNTRKPIRPQSMIELTSKNQFEPVNRRPRPTTLRFFAEAARPGPLPPRFLKQASAEEVNCNAVLERVSEGVQVQIVNHIGEPGSNAEQKSIPASYSQDTIANNNVLEQQDNKNNDIQSDLTDANSNNLNTNNDERNQSARSRDLKSSTRNREHAGNRRLFKSHSIHDTKREKFPARDQNQRRMVGLTRSASEWSIDDPDNLGYCFINGEMKEQTHRAAFKFVPRHSDELAFEINDPLHVTEQSDDHWFEAINMRTGSKGVFPAYYAQSVEEDSDDASVCSSIRDESSDKFNLYFLGSVEVTRHKGNDILCQAMQNVAHLRRETLHRLPPAFVCLMVNSQGIRMMDQSLMRQKRCGATTKPDKLFSSDVKVRERTHYFRLANVSFCGHHPRNDKYFAFITRHPDSPQRFACHVFVSETSTRPLAHSIGKAFGAFYQQFIETSHPIEDIYIE